MMLKAVDCGVTQGIVRERRCPNCGAVLFTHERVIHVQSRKAKGKSIFLK